MTAAATEFDAPASASGYYYQARFALLESLRFVYRESGIEVSVERFDDVSFEANASVLERLQTKHQIKRRGSLTDASPDLWKTLRIWSEAAKRDPSLPSRTRFALITTGTAPDGSAASHLRPEAAAVRNVDIAARALETVAAKSGNKALRPAFEAFLRLAPEIRRALLAAVEVLDQAPRIGELGAALEDTLRVIAPRGKAGLAREQLEGWWYPRLFRALEAGIGTIPILEIEAKLDDIRESMKRDALPTDMEHFDPPVEELQALDEMNFVRQLLAINTGDTRIGFAKRDYYRASAQRSKWARLSLLVDGEVERFERMLIEEWQPRYHRMCDGLDANAEPHAIRNAGRDLYHWVESEARFPFRTVTSRFISVGSYHILANDFRVGWHRDYEKLRERGQGGGDDK